MKQDTSKEMKIVTKSNIYYFAILDILLCHFIYIL